MSGLPHPNTDLRAVYAPARDPRVDALEAKRLAAVRRERPSLGQIATACRQYHDGGSARGLWQIMAAEMRPPRRQLDAFEYQRFYDTGELPAWHPDAEIDLDVEPRDDPRTAWLYEPRSE